MQRLAMQFYNFHATIFTANLQSLITHECDLELEKINETRNLDYQFNRNIKDFKFIEGLKSFSIIQDCAYFFILEQYFHSYMNL